MKIEEPHLTPTFKALQDAPTLLENFLWSWLLGITDSDTYFRELLASDLSGPGYVTDDFRGEL